MNYETHIKISKILRYSLLGSILAVVTVLGRLHSVNKAIPPIDSFCPFGGLESLYFVISQGVFLRRVALSSLILLVATVLLALIFRRSFCGRICPLGFMQELAGKIGKLIFRGRKFQTPNWLHRVDKIARYLKYIVLIYFLVMTWLTGILAIRAYDPWVAFHHLGSDELLTSYLIGFIILIFSMVMSLFVGRPFCRYLCPMGAFLGPISKIGIFKIKRNIETCIDCGKCSEACPVSIEVDKLDSVTSAECLNCGDCEHACPVPDTLVQSAPRKKLPLKPWIVTLLVLAIFGGTVAATSMTGDFIWNKNAELPKTYRRILKGSEYINTDNSLLEVVYAFQLPPQIFLYSYPELTEEDFYITLEDAELDPEKIKEAVDLYIEAMGENLPGRGSGGGGCSDDH